MNKILTKVTAFCVGLAMVAGVGVAVGSKSVGEAKADSANFTLSSASEVTVDGVTASFAKGSGSNAPAWYAAGLRLYASNTVTISSSDTITGVSFNWEKQGSKAFSTVTANVGSYSHPSAAGTGTWSGSANEIVFTLGSSGQLQLNTFSVTYETGGSSATLESIEVTGAMTKTAYTTLESWDPSGLVVTAHYDDSSSKTVTGSAEWTYSPAAPADGVTSVVATASYGGKTDSSSAQSVSVTVAHAGTSEDPFTVPEALAKANEIGAVGNTGQGPWVTKGIISRVTSAPAATYWNATYYISEDGTQSNELQVYRGFYLDNAKFDAETALLMKAGMIVTVTGNLTGSYGCEYCQGNYLLSIEEPAAGDVDVTFEPASTSFEIGATGTFTASSETSGVTYEWSVDHSDVLSVNSSTGAYEALALGVARVTVTASAGGKEGSAHVDFVVNGSAGTYYTVANANTIASGVTSGQTTAYYIYVEGYVKEFATSSKDGNPRAFDIMTLDETASIMVYTNVNPYADFINGLSLGDRIVVKGKIQNYNGTYEIVEPEKVGSNASAITFALGFISQTDAVCEDYDGVSSNKDALEAIWEGLYTSYNALYDNQKSILMGAERDEGGTHVEQAVARYDYLVGKYGLDNFITGRTPVSFPAGAYLNSYENNLDSSSSITIIVIVAVASMTLLGVTLVIRKRKMN